MATATMKALRLHGRAQPPAFVYEDAPRPDPAPGEVLIRVQAAAVTPTELAWSPTSTTQSGEPRPLPLVMGHEFSGDVAALGADVTDLAVGDAVYGMNDWFRDGAQAEYCVARATQVAAKPRTLDHVQAAAVPISALTAWQGLFERARLTAGERVLVHGASGAVGAFVVQLARWRNAEVIATASARHLEFVRRLGAERLIDYRSERFDDLVRDIDVVFDTVGGETLTRSWDVLRTGGRIVTIAASEEATQDARVRAAFFIVEPNRSQLAEIARLLDGGILRVSTGDVFPLRQGQDAYAHDSEHGKAVLRMTA